MSLVARKNPVNPHDMLDQNYHNLPFSRGPQKVVHFSTNRRCLWPRVSICERDPFGGARERLKWKTVTMVAKWLTS